MSYPELRLLAEMYEDAQKSRIAAENRVRSGGVDSGSLAVVVDHYKSAEHLLGLDLRRCFRRTAGASVRAWQKGQKGIGEHLVARLLGVLGDPYIASPMHWEPGKDAKRVLVADEPFTRSVSQLWSYCGHGDATRKRAKGMTQDEALALGNPRAKMLVHLIAEGCVKSDGPYRKVYVNDRHSRGDVQAPEGWTSGSELTKQHSHNRALRRVAKEVLRDLWTAAREDHADGGVQHSDYLEVPA